MDTERKHWTAIIRTQTELIKLIERVAKLEAEMKLIKENRCNCEATRTA